MQVFCRLPEFLEMLFYSGREIFEQSAHSVA
jgi:hypothetical protein